MKTVLAVAFGYLIGAKSGGRVLDQLGQSLKTLCGTEEFADVLQRCPEPGRPALCRADRLHGRRRG